MKRRVFSKTLAILAVTSAAVFAGAARADAARLAIQFGAFCPPAAFSGPQLPGHRHGVDWHDGFGPVSRIEQRQRQQHERIIDGVRAGDLTRREAQALAREQDRIRTLARNFWHSDGRLSADEWLRLDHAQERASRHIWQQRHDYQARY